jgi:hypothetical protein
MKKIVKNTFGLFIFLCTFLGIQINCSTKNSDSEYDTTEIENASIEFSKLDDNVGNTGNRINIANKKMDEVKPTVFTYTPQPNTREISLQEMQQLKSVDSGGVFHFDSNAVFLDSITAGTTVFFKGHSIKKISTIAKTNGEYTISTSEALFTDFFKDADIAWNGRINWGNTKLTARAKPRFFSFGNASYAQEMPEMDNQSINVSTEIKGWNIGVSVQPNSNKLNVEIKAEKAGKCNITGTGFLSRLNQSGTIKAKDGKVEEVELTNDGVQGEMTVTVNARGLGSQVDLVTLPIKIEKMIIVEGIPVFLRLKALLKIYPELKANHNSTAGFKVAYDSKQGFSYKNNNFSTAPSHLLNSALGQSQKGRTSGKDACGIGVGLELPRFEIGIFDKVIVPYFTNNISVTTYYEQECQDCKKCHHVGVQMSGSVGVNLDFFGLASFNASKQIYTKEKKFRKGKCV